MSLKNMFPGGIVYHTNDAFDFMGVNKSGFRQALEFMGVGANTRKQALRAVGITKENFKQVRRFVGMPSSQQVQEKSSSSVAQEVID